MVEFEQFMSIGLEQCAPSGPGSGGHRNETFAALVQLWNREKETIESMSASEVRENLVCP